MIYHGFDNKEDLEQKFNVSLDHVNILYSDYYEESYSGDATVFFEQDGKLFEVHASHCSCYGLENQWSPESCTVEDILLRAENQQIPYVDCTLLKKSIENWMALSHLNIDFSFEDLPNANDFASNVNNALKNNTQKTLANKEYFSNKETVFKELKKNIITSIKEAVLTSSDSFEVKHHLQINPTLKNNVPIEQLNALILEEFKGINDILTKKNWKSNMFIKDDFITLDIKIPSLTQINKKNRHKTML